MFQQFRCIWLVGLMLVAYAPLANAERLPEGNNTVPILGFMSGYNSCPSRWYGDIHGTTMGSAADSLIQRIAREADVDQIEYVVSCFPRSTERVRFVTSADHGAHRYHGYVDHVVEEIVALARKHPDHVVHLAGHSYGGWLAMYVVSQLPRWVNIGVLVTIDPISPVTCNPSTFIRSILRSSVFLAPHAGCTQAPQDVPLGLAQKRSKTWMNYYQSAYYLLHSGKILTAHRNERIDFHDDEYTEAHVLIEEDDRIWVDYNHSVMQHLDRKPPTSH